MLAVEAAAKAKQAHDEIQEDSLKRNVTEAKADAHAAAYFALAASHHHENARRAMIKLEAERKKEQAYKDHLAMQDRPTVYVVEPNDAMLRKNGSL